MSTLALLLKFSLQLSTAFFLRNQKFTIATALTHCIEFLTDAMIRELWPPHTRIHLQQVKRGLRAIPRIESLLAYRGQFLLATSLYTVIFAQIMDQLPGC